MIKNNVNPVAAEGAGGERGEGEEKGGEPTLSRQDGVCSSQGMWGCRQVGKKVDRLISLLYDRTWMDRERSPL